MQTEDLSSLDVKCSRSKQDSKFDDIDLMFKAMEPVILKTEIIEICRKNEMVTKKNSKFEAIDVELENFDGWGDEITNWIDPEEIVE